MVAITLKLEHRE